MISSKANPKIKNIIKLQKGSERRRQGLTPVEGLREIERALRAGWEADSLFYCQEIAEKKIETLLPLLDPKCQTELLTEGVYNHIAYRDGSDGILALFRPKTLSINEIKLSSNPLVVILEAVEKPGNFGAVLRTTDAAGVDAVIICDPLADVLNPNVIRSSLGCIFSQQVVATSSEQAIEWLKKNNIKILATSLIASKDYLTADFTLPSAIVMGTESTGLSDQWINASHENILIEMMGIADSLNVSVAAAVVVFEAIRQRKQRSGKI